MSLTTETEHKKNVANFSTAYQIFEEMGSFIEPFKLKFAISKLAPIKVSLGGTITVLNDKKPIYKYAVADREVEIAPLGKLTTRALNFAKSTNISTTYKENLTSQAKKSKS